MLIEAYKAKFGEIENSRMDETILECINLEI